MGHQAAQRLRERGHTVIGVGRTSADVIADLSTPQGRRAAAEGVLAASNGVLDGAVLAAGLGPGSGADRLQLLAQVNFLGVVELLEAWQPALAATGNAKVVVLGSNSTTTVPAVSARAVRALLAHDTEKAIRAVRMSSANRSVSMYGASKVAVSRWVRRHAVTAPWIGAGIRLNALAPGAIMTPLLERQLADPRDGKALREFPVPVRGFGDADQIAEWICLMLSDSADFLCGSVIFIDGGTDAYFRAEDWPAAVSLRGLPRYLWRYLQGRKSG